MSILRLWTGLLVLMFSGTLWTNVQAAAVAATNQPAASAIDSGAAAKAAQGEPWRLSFGLDGVGFLQSEFPKGIQLWLYPASLLYALLALAAAKFLDFLARSFLKRWSERSKTKFDEVAVTLVDGPIKVMAFVILLHVGLEMLPWPQWIEDYLGKVLTIAVALSLTYMATKFVDLFMTYWRTRSAADADKSFDEHLFPIIRKSLKIFLVVVAALVTAQNMGVNITSLIASLSIGGLALGLAAQDTLANVFGAVSVLVDKPFKVGDRIKLDTIDGTVEAIGLRSTRIRNLDGFLVTVPNKTIGGATITNVSRRSTIKTEMNIGVTYDTPTERLKHATDIIKEIYKSHPMTADLIVSFNRFADSALNIIVAHWWNGTDHKAYLEGMQSLNLQLKKRFDEEGIEFAFPSQTVYLKSDSDLRTTPPTASAV